MISVVDKQARRRDLQRTYVQKYARSPLGIYKVLKNNSAKKGKVMGITKEEFVLWYSAQDQFCAYCGIAPNQIIELPDFRMSMRYKDTERFCDRLTIDRMDSTKPYHKSNMILACYRCNAIKSNFFTHQEMLVVGELVKRKWQQCYQ